MPAPNSPQERSLYDRMGGDSFFAYQVSSYFDELAEDRELGKFFRHVPMETLKSHQVRFFKVCFGDNPAEPGALIDYLLITHTRLFRDLGMDETHFDHVATCFVQSLQSFQIDQPLIDEAVALLTPLRAVFEYGAKIAKREKELTENGDGIQSLPVLTASTVGSDNLDQRLPEYPSDVPNDLPGILSQIEKHPNREHKALPSDSIVRAWTCALSEAWQGNKEVGNTFLDMAFLHHHVYAIAFLELAFFDKKHYEGHKKALQTVLYPRGEHKPPLSQALFRRMVACFEHVADKMALDKQVTQGATKRLEKLTPSFAKKTHKVSNSTHFIDPMRQQQQKSVVVLSNLEDLENSSTTSSPSGSYSGSHDPNKSKRKSTVSHKTLSTTSADGSMEQCSEAGKKNSGVMRRLFGRRGTKKH